MKTHNRILFHCLCCGKVVHAEPQDAVPTCCGQRMINAAAETVANGDDEPPQDVTVSGRKSSGPGVPAIPR
jgi:hypothetical protein